MINSHKQTFAQYCHIILLINVKTLPMQNHSPGLNYNPDKCQQQVTKRMWKSNLEGQSSKLQSCKKGFLITKGENKNRCMNSYVLLYMFLKY